MGVECYRNMTVDYSSCPLPCKGIFADVTKEKAIPPLHLSEGFSAIYEQYEKYKRGFSDDIKYPKKIRGIPNQCYR